MLISSTSKPFVHLQVLTNIDIYLIVCDYQSVQSQIDYDCMTLEPKIPC